MTRFTLAPATANTVQALKQAHLVSLAAPLDGMWQSFADMADQFEIRADDVIVGFCAVNADRQLLQFFCRESVDPQGAYAHIVEALGLTGAVVPTCDPAATALAMDHQKTVSVNALMYHHHGAASPASFPDGTALAVLSAQNLKSAVAFAHKTLGASEDWLHSYFSGLIAAGELFGLWLEDILIATGECRASDSQPAISDVGMVVGTDHRQQGIATNMLRAMVSEATRRGHKAICSTETGNGAAQKAINRAEFICYHRILEVKF